MMHPLILRYTLVSALLLPLRALSQETTEIRESPPVERNRSIGLFLEVPDDSRNLRLFTGVFYQWKHRAIDLRAGLYYSSMHSYRFYNIQPYEQDTFTRSYHESDSRIGGIMAGLEWQRAFWKKLHFMAGVDIRLGVGRIKGTSRTEYVRFDATRTPPEPVVARSTNSKSDEILVQWSVRPYIGGRMVWPRITAGIDVGLNLDQIVGPASQGSFFSFDAGFPTWRLMAGWRI